MDIADDGSGDAVSGNETEATSHRIHLKGARHPCVELMESVQFIPNDYNLGGENGKGSFQIVTGPNMVCRCCGCSTFFHAQSYVYTALLPIIFFWGYD